MKEIEYPANFDNWPTLWKSCFNDGVEACRKAMQDDKPDSPIAKQDFTDFEEWFGIYATDGSDAILHSNIKVNTSIRDAFQAGRESVQNSELRDLELELTEMYEYYKFYIKLNKHGTAELIKKLKKLSGYKKGGSM